VSEKGRLAIPNPLGDNLAMGCRTVEADPLDALVGLLPSMDVDVVITAMRLPRWDKELDEG